MVLLNFVNTCANDSLVEKNIESYLYEKFPELDILSIKYSDLFILHPLNYEMIPMTIDTVGMSAMDKFSAALSHKYDVSGAGVAMDLIVKGCNKKVINDIIRYDELFRQYETGAKDYVKIAYVKLEDKYGDIYKDLVCFKIDSLYNVEDMYLVEDHDYVYGKVID